MKRQYHNDVWYSKVAELWQISVCIGLLGAYIGESEKLAYLIS